MLATLLCCFQQLTYSNSKNLNENQFSKTMARIISFLLVIVHYGLYIIWLAALEVDTLLNRFQFSKELELLKYSKKKDL